MERAAEPAERFRRLCLALPEAYEQETWGSATYRVRGRIFVMQGGEAGAVTVTCCSPKRASRRRNAPAAPAKRASRCRRQLDGFSIGRLSGTRAGASGGQSVVRLR